MRARAALVGGLVAALVAGCGDDGDGTGCGGDSVVVVADRDSTDDSVWDVAEVHAVRADGTSRKVTGDWVANDAAVSPDARELVVVRADGDYESSGPDSTALWRMGIDGSAPRLVVEGGPLVEDPAWSPDGSTIAYARWSAVGDRSTWSIATVPADGGPPTELYEAEVPARLQAPVWSPDGSRLAFVRKEDLPLDQVGPEDGFGASIWTMAGDGSDLRRVAAVPYDAASLSWSPVDGSSLLVDSDSGDHELHLVDVATGRSRLVATGADLGRWAPDGRSLYYFADHGTDGAPDWRLEQGHLEDGALRRDREVPEGDVDLYPYFDLDVTACG